LEAILTCPANFLHAELESGLLKDGQVKRARFTEEQIIGVLREHEAGAKTADLTRKHGVSEATLYNWKAKYGGMDVPRGQAAEAARGRERQVEEAVGGADAGCRRTPRAAGKKW
jgi:putative transposase